MATNPAVPSVPSSAIPTRFIDGDLVIYLSDQTTLVSSKSHPDSWRIVEDLTRCSCEGFAIRGRCRHIDEAKIAAQIDRDTAVPVALLPEATLPRTIFTGQLVCIDCGTASAQCGVRCIECMDRYYRQISCHECNAASEYDESGRLPEGWSEGSGWQGSYYFCPDCWDLNMCDGCNRPAQLCGCP